VRPFCYFTVMRSTNPERVTGEGTSPAIPGSEGNIKGSSPPLKERSEGLVVHRIHVRPFCYFTVMRSTNPERVTGEGTSPAIPGSEGNIKGSSPPLKERSEGLVVHRIHVRPFCCYEMLPT